MAALLPLLFGAFAALLLISRVSETDAPFGRREAFLAGAILSGAFTTAVAELASLLRLFNRATVTGLWLLATLLLAGIAFWKKPAAGRAWRVPKRLEPPEKALLFGSAALVAAVGLTAWAAAPNNWDAMTYHLPRVLHWIQNGSVAHYPTHILRQLTLGPGAEFAVAQLELLGGSDRLVAFVQALAWLGAAAAVSLVAADLGAGRAGQLLAAIFALTLPMGILQASGARNDLLTAFWLLAFVHFSLRVLRGEAGVLSWLAVGGSIGLALLTKATAYLFAFPFVLALGWAAVRGRRSRYRGLLAVAALFAMLLNSGYWARNTALFGKPLGGDHGTVNAAVSPAILLSNLARNAALQLTAPFSGWNRSVEEAVLGLHAALRIGANDPRSTWRGAEFSVPAGLRGSGRADSDEALYTMFQEDQAGNPLHLLLLAAAAILVIVRRSLRRRRALIGYLSAVSGAFLLFNLVLKWQPWGSRLLLPVFLLGAPLFGAALFGESRGPWSAAIAAMLLIGSCPWAVLNATRPLVGPDSVLTTPRIDQSFAARPALREPFGDAAKSIVAAGCQHIGLEIGPDDPEYLLWISLRAAGAPAARFEHVHVTNRSAQAAGPPYAGLAPCVVIALSPKGEAATGRELFAREWAGGRIAVRAPP